MHADVGLFLKQQKVPVSAALSDLEQSKIFKNNLRTIFIINPLMDSSPKNSVMIYLCFSKQFFS